MQITQHLTRYSDETSSQTANIGQGCRNQTGSGEAQDRIRQEESQEAKQPKAGTREVASDEKVFFFRENTGRISLGLKC